MKKIILLSLTLLGACGFEVIDTGHRGVKTRFGEIQGNPFPEGLYFYNPLTSSIEELNVQEQKFEGKASANTKDTQVAEITFTATYYPEAEEIGNIYKQYGLEWDKKIIPNIVEANLKIAIGKFDAGDLVFQQDAAAHKSFEIIKNSLQEKHVTLGSLSFVNIDFSDSFEKAVEAKVVAQQKASEAKNHTVEVEEQAKQTLLSAKAEAESMRIRAQALQQNKGLVNFEAVKKWNGVLPTSMYGSTPIPFLNVKD